MLLRPNRRKFLGTAAAGAAVLATPRFLQAQPDHVRAAFVYVGPVGDHGWTYRHDVGRLEVEKAFPGQVTTSFVESVKAWHFVLGAYAGFIAMVFNLFFINLVTVGLHSYAGVG